MLKVYHSAVITIFGATLQAFSGPLHYTFAFFRSAASESKAGRWHARRGHERGGDFAGRLASLDLASRASNSNQIDVSEENHGSC